MKNGTKDGKRRPSAFISYWRRAWRSGFDMGLYRRVRRRPWTAGLSHLLATVGVLGLLAGVAFFAAALSGLSGLRERVAETVPEGASLSVVGGQLSAALPMPFVIDLGQGLALTFDTALEGTDRPPEGEIAPGLTFGRDAVFADFGSGTEIVPIRDWPSLYVTKRQAVDWLERSALPLAAALALFFAVVAFFSLFSGTALFVLIGTVLAWSLSGVFRVRIGYSHWLAVGLYAATWPLYAAAAFWLMGWRSVPVFPVIFFMIMGSVLADERAVRNARSGQSPDGANSLEH